MIHEYNKVEQSYVETVTVLIMKGEGVGAGGGERLKIRLNRIKTYYLCMKRLHACYTQSSHTDFLLTFYKCSRSRRN